MTKRGVDMKPILKGYNRFPFQMETKDSISHLTEEELNRITLEFQKWYEERPNSKRARYFLVFLFLRYTGGRISEIIGIDELRDIDLKRSEIRLRNLKRKNKNSYRIVPVPDKLIAEYLRLIHIHPDIKGKAFKIFRNNFFRIFREICKKSSVPKEISHPHILRHTRAIELVRNLVPITAVKTLLGHSNLNTTAVYLNYSASEIKEILRLKGLI